MPRSFTYSALTLRVKPSGQSNREAWFLTAEEGIVRATVFGGPKSRLRSRIAPFHEGTLWIYHDPVRDSRKASDFDVQSYRPGIRELYERAMTADALAETVLASHGGGGGWPAAMKLAGSVLDALDEADTAFCSRLGVYFLWHWADILGVRPELPGGEDRPLKAAASACCSCDAEARRESALWYAAGSQALFCENCAQKASPPLIRLCPGARLWLNKIESLSAAALARVTLDGPSLEQARTLSKAVLAGALERRLATWENI